MAPSLLFKILHPEGLSERALRELEICKYMLSEEELLEISSIRVGYEIARERLIETVIKESDPELYNKVKSATGKFPIFGLLEEARRIRGEVDFSAEAILKAEKKIEEKETREEKEEIPELELSLDSLQQII